MSSAQINLMAVTVRQQNYLTGAGLKTPRNIEYTNKTSPCNMDDDTQSPCLQAYPEEKKTEHVTLQMHSVNRTKETNIIIWMGGYSAHFEAMMPPSKLVGLAIQQN